MTEQKKRILRFVREAYEQAEEDGTAEMKLTITINPKYEQFTIEKSGHIRREVEE